MSESINCPFKLFHRCTSNITFTPEWIVSYLEWLGFCCILNPYCSYRESNCHFITSESYSSIRIALYHIRMTSHRILIGLNDFFSLFGWMIRVLYRVLSFIVLHCIVSELIGLYYTASHSKWIESCCMFTFWHHHHFVDSLKSYHTLR